MLGLCMLGLCMLGLCMLGLGMLGLGMLGLCMLGLGMLGLCMLGLCMLGLCMLGLGMLGLGMLGLCAAASQQRVCGVLHGRSCSGSDSAVIALHGVPTIIQVQISVVEVIWCRQALLSMYSWG